MAVPLLTVRAFAAQEADFPRLVAALGNRVIGDILQRRGTFEAPAIGGGEFTVEARLPVATSLDYPTRLGSLSGGRGMLSTRFDGYQECPRDQAKYILAARKAL